MTVDWAIIGVIVAVVTGVFTYMQLVRTPKAASSPSFTTLKYKRLEERLENARAAISRKDLLLFLRWKYHKEPILERAGYVYPVAIYPAPKLQREDLRSVLKSFLVKDEENDKPLIDRSEYIDIVNSLKPGKGLTLGKEVNTLVYAMKFLEIDDKIQLECKLGRYFTSYRSSEVLEWEIRSSINKLKGTSEKHFSDFNDQLPLRKYLHEKVSNPVVDGTGRTAAIGTSVLIAYNDNGVIKLLTKRRSSKGVPLRAGLLHVIPSFMFQPTTNEVDDEFDITHNIYREYLEELFNLPENFAKNRHPSYFDSDKRLIYLKKLVAAGNASLYFTGITVNLLNLRPEICALLLIRTPEWYEKCKNDPELHWDLNDEFYNIHRIEDEGIVKQQELIGGITFSMDDNQMLEQGSIYPDRTVPAGAGAFWLGVEVLKELLPST